VQGFGSSKLLLQGPEPQRQIPADLKSFCIQWFTSFHTVFTASETHLPHSSGQL